MLLYAMLYCRSGKVLPDKIKTLMLKYVSAFANHEGGHIFFGIDDVRAAVIGEIMSEAEQRETGQWFCFVLKTLQHNTDYQKLTNIV